MAASLSVLILEDRPADAERMWHELRRAGFEPTGQRVETEAGYLAHLDPAPDLVLASDALPQFDALRALHLLQARGLEIPFILVTPLIHPEVAVECLRQRAADCLPKDRLDRLGVVVTQALAQARARRERVQAEEALRQSEERYRSLVEEAVEGLFRITPDGRWICANLALAHILGYESSEEMQAKIGKIPDLFVDPDCCPELRQWFLQGQGILRGFEFQAYRRDGHVIWVSVSVRIVRDASGTPLYYEGFAEDITTRRQVRETDTQLLQQVREEAQANSALLWLEATLGRTRGTQAVCEAAVGLIPQLFASAQAHVWLWDRERKRLLPVALPPESSERQRTEFFHPDVPYEQQGDFAEVLRARRLLSVPDARRDPRISEVVWREFGIGSFLLIPLLEDYLLLGIICICRSKVSAFSRRDVEMARGTAQRIALALQGEQAREEVQQQFTRISLLNQIARAIAERQDLESIFRVVLSQLESHLPMDYGGILLLNPESDTFTIVARGPKSQLLAAQWNVPERELLPVAHTPWRVCTQGETVYVPDMAQMEIPTLQQAVQAGMHAAVGVPLMVEDKVLGVLVAARCQVDGFSREERDFLQILSKHVALAAYHARLHSDLQHAYDELRQTQHAVMRQERLRALGQMASGIAHDINNALSPIVGFSDLLLMRELNLPDRAKSYLKLINTAGTDIAQIVARMREFYRQREQQELLLPVNLNLLVLQGIDLTRPRWRDIPQERGIVIAMQTDLYQDPPPVRGIESEIREVLTNLILNAVDAMPAGGTVRIRTRVAAGQGGKKAEESSLDAILEVSDTGIGMDEETRHRCLEPFFSTKGELGTGLGLSMVFGAMQRHEGDIQIESEPGQGTTVRLVFPLCASEADPPSFPPMEGGDRPRGTLRVLYIDDEPMLRILMKDMLESEGHTVEVADGGQAGLERFRAAQEQGKPFDVVITDLGMPYVDGRAVAHAIKRQSSITPVILLTGWGARRGAEGDLPMEIDAVLSKPPQLNEVREVLQWIRPR
ncbi:MAG: GAF domain-containing protein [Candidatus Tectomicrobia bacterium]|uniref:histidine kinase n=1 Tax=Tectimicrobiota bacterium TaxID=2528274 RepID=A0A932FX40_UNCTE|nr:GAF domain-containing protein [Candidatus Tectomicrobia bacterium]